MRKRREKCGKFKHKLKKIGDEMNSANKKSVSVCMCRFFFLTPFPHYSNIISQSIWKWKWRKIIFEIEEKSEVLLELYSHPSLAQQGRMCFSLFLMFHHHKFSPYLPNIRFFCVWSSSSSYSSSSLSLSFSSLPPWLFFHFMVVK